MKRQLATILAFFAVSSITWGAKALPGLQKYVQPDGSVIAAELIGDEHHHWLQTADGVLLVNTHGACYVASIADDGSLQATNILAHQMPQRTKAETAAAMRQQERMALWTERGRSLAAEAMRREPAIGTDATAPYLPHTDSPRVLIILAEYPDQQFTVANPIASFEQYFNGDTQVDLGQSENRNAMSVKKYFEGSSMGQFSPQFDIVGPVMLSDNMAVYGNSDNLSLLGRHACEAVKSQIDDFDFSIYDNDGDGKAELVCIIYAGYGENEGGATETMWAKAQRVGYAVNDTISINRFCCSSELAFAPSTYTAYNISPWPWINGIGVFCHEFSHCLGLPDLYPQTAASRSVNNQNMEDWSLMDGGLYLNNGFAPCAYNAWEQEVMGWTEITAISEPLQSVSILPVLEGGEAYKIVNPANDNEFIVMENIQRRGYNSRARGHGLLVYHIDYASSSVNMNDSPNNIAGHPRVAVVPADSLVISYYQVTGRGYNGTYSATEHITSEGGDPFPGTSNITQLTDSMHRPNFLFYTNAETGDSIEYCLTGIAEDTETGIVTFSITKGDGSETAIAAPRAEYTAVRDDDAVFTLDGRRISAANRQRGIYVKRNKKIIE